MTIIRGLFMFCIMLSLLYAITAPSTEESTQELVWVTIFMVFLVLYELSSVQNTLSDIQKKLDKEEEN